MKIPLLPLHILTTKAIKKIRDEQRAVTRKITCNILDENEKMKRLINRLPAKYKHGRKLRCKRKA